jgi:hypothetical protein
MIAAILTVNAEAGRTTGRIRSKTKNDMINETNSRLTSFQRASGCSWMRTRMLPGLTALARANED